MPINTATFDYGSLYTGAPTGPPGPGGMMGQLAPFIPAAMGQFGMSMPAGMQMGPFSLGQNVVDWHANQQFFNLQQQALSRTAEIQEDQAYAIIRGGHAAMGMTEAQWNREDTQTRARRMASDLSRAGHYGLPIMENFLPGVRDALGGREGSAQMLVEQLSIANRYRQDPVSGRMGYDADTLGQLTTDIREQLYGPGAKMSDVAGYKMGRLGQIIEAGTRRGYGPTSGGGDVDSMPGGTTDAALRNFDATKIANWAKEWTGAIRAIEDVVGPGKPVDELINAMNAMTQGGLTSKRPGEIAKILRTDVELSKMAGMGTQESMRLTSMAAQVAEQAGADRFEGVIASQHARGFAAAFKETGGLGDLQAAGMSPEEVAAQDAQLTAQAAGSPVKQQLDATMRISQTIGFREGSEGAKIVQAVKEGKSTYMHGGVRKNIYAQRGWADMMSRSSNNPRFTSAEAARWRTQTGTNARYARTDEWDTTLSTRGAQWDVEIRPAMEQAAASAARRTGMSEANQAAFAREAAEHAQNFEARDDESREETWARRNREIAEMGGRYGIAPGDRALFAQNTLGAMETRARDQFKARSLHHMGLMHREETLKQERINNRTATAHGELRTKLQHLGRDTAAGRFFSELMSMKPGDDKSAGEFFGKVLGFIPEEEIDKALGEGGYEKMQQAIREYEGVVAEGRSIDPSATGALAKHEERRKAALAKLDPHLEALDAKLKEDEAFAKALGASTDLRKEELAAGGAKPIDDDPTGQSPSPSGKPLKIAGIVPVRIVDDTRPMDGSAHAGDAATEMAVQNA